jgi:hypothetical protein
MVSTCFSRSLRDSRLQDRPTPNVQTLGYYRISLRDIGSSCMCIQFLVTLGEDARAPERRIHAAARRSN